MAPHIQDKIYDMLHQFLSQSPSSPPHIGCEVGVGLSPTSFLLQRQILSPACSLPCLQAQVPNPGWETGCLHLDEHHSSPPVWISSGFDLRGGISQQGHPVPVVLWALDDPGWISVIFAQTFCICEAQILCKNWQNHFELFLHAKKETTTIIKLPRKCFTSKPNLSQQ